MKIYDVIAENKVEEGVKIPPKATGALASAGAALFKPAKNLVGKLFNTDRSQLVKAIADSLGSSKWAGEATAAHAAKAAKGLGSKAVDMVKADKSILDDAAKAANKSRGLSLFGKVGDDVGKVTGAAGKITKGVMVLTPIMIHVYNAYNIYGFFKEYNANVDAWEKELRAKGLSEEEFQKQMAYIRQSEMGLLIPKVGAALLGGAIIRGTAAPISALLKASKFTAPLGYVVGGLGRLGTMYLYDKLNSKEGSEMFASVLVGNALGDKAIELMGAAGTRAVDWMKGTAKEAQAADQGQSGNQPAQGGGATTTPTTAPAAATTTASGKQVIQDPDKAKTDQGGFNSVTAGTTTGKLYTPVGYKRDAQGNLVLDDD